MVRRIDPDPHAALIGQYMLETLAHSVRKMTLLLQKLSRGEAPERNLPLPLAQVTPLLEPQRHKLAKSA